MLSIKHTEDNFHQLWIIGAKDDEGGGNNWSYKSCKKALVKL